MVNFPLNPRPPGIVVPRSTLPAEEQIRQLERRILALEQLLQGLGSNPRAQAFIQRGVLLVPVRDAERSENGVTGELEVIRAAGLRGIHVFDHEGTGGPDWFTTT